MPNQGPSEYNLIVFDLGMHISLISCCGQLFLICCWPDLDPWTLVLWTWTWRFYSCSKHYKKPVNTWQFMSVTDQAKTVMRGHAWQIWIPSCISRHNLTSHLTWRYLSVMDLPQARQGPIHCDGTNRNELTPRRIFLIDQFKSHGCLRGYYFPSQISS